MSEEYIKSIIKAQGPLTIAQYMAICLSDSEHGYYIKNIPLGKEGDFITSPEISQMFGELLGIWSATMWQNMDMPDDIAIVELGPGKGTLMSDFLRGTENVPGFHDSISVHLVEISPALKEAQKKTLEDFDIDIEWHQTFSEIPKKPSIIIGNEFFDALPIHQFVKTVGGWREKMVVETEDGILNFSLSPTETTSCALIPENLRNSPEDSVVEVCPSMIVIAQEIAAHIIENGGVALFIDYGYEESLLKSTFQAVKDHKFHDPLQNPCEADLTTFVDFSAIKKVAKENKINVHGCIDQADLLKKLGIDVRAKMLSQNASEKQKQEIELQLERIIGENQMGRLFKCLALSNPLLPTPIGFEDDPITDV